MTKHRKLNSHLDKYKGTTVINIKTDIIAASLIGQAVTMYLETFKTDVIVLIDNVIICLTSHWPMFFSSRVSSLILEMSLSKIKGKMYTLPIIYDMKKNVDLISNRTEREIATLTNIHSFNIWSIMISLCHNIIVNLSPLRALD